MANNVRICWCGADGEERFTSMSSFPGSGILIVGGGMRAVGGGWIPVTANTGSINGNWSAPYYANDPAVGDVGTPTATPFIITNGIIDTGAGGLDALIIARPAL
jgi:hypothetical protein